MKASDQYGGFANCVFVRKVENKVKKYLKIVT